MVKESRGALNSMLQMIHGLGILTVLTCSFVSQPQTEMEAVCGSFWVTFFLPHSPKSNLPLFRSTHQHLTAFPSQSHLFLYHPPPYANAKTLRARTSSKLVIFLLHLIASLEQVDHTYIMVKPDGVQRGLVGEIISRFEKKGFKLTGLKLFECLCEHYKDLKQKLFFPKLIDYITSGPVVCMAWEGVGIVASARKLIGATYPLQAEPGTIRGDLAVQTRRNVVHGSDNPENGKREIGWFVGLNQTNLSTKRLLNADQTASSRANHQLPILDVVHEVAVYIHRFHNLNLFEQGWYRIKITLRWEDGDDSHPGVLAGVAQYEAPKVGADNLCGVLMIDDKDNSFSTSSFRIRYARQDVILAIMISFYVSYGRYKGKSSVVILKFELFHTPTPKIREVKKKTLKVIDLFNRKKLSEIEIHSNIDLAKGTATDQLAFLPLDRRSSVLRKGRRRRRRQRGFGEDSGTSDTITDLINEASYDFERGGFFVLWRTAKYQ
ncbi:Nucleoside diphosphate kinase 2, chloroplastic [Glycine max]|nr:Nucleoside diphosphate kinase 2, chloroplastic [Glycine max]